MALMALGALCASCGGNEDDSSDQPLSAGPGTPARTAVVPREDPSAPSTGGATAPRGATEPSGSEGPRSDTEDPGDESVSPAPPSEPQQPAKRKSRKRVTRDVYKAGKQTCFIFGIDQIRHEYELVQRTPEAVARFYANLFEKANPELVAPYYQGCLRGLKQRAERDRRVNQR
jgi:hypothetical protein